MIVLGYYLTDKVSFYNKKELRDTGKTQLLIEDLLLVERAIESNWEYKEIFIHRYEKEKEQMIIACEKKLNEGLSGYRYIIKDQVIIDTLYNIKN